MVRQEFDLPQVAQATRGFVGAELEAVVKDAMFPAFRERRQMTTHDLLRSAGDMVPLAKSHARRIEALRQLVTAGQCRNASVRDQQLSVDFDQIRGSRLIDL